MKKAMRFISAVTLFCLFACCDTDSAFAQSTKNSAAENQAVLPNKHMQVFKKYCMDCHDAGTMEGKLNLEDLSFEISKDIPTAQTWSDILAAINASEMPPEDSEQISKTEKTEFLRDLSVQMVKARNILSDSGGQITMRRLNRREYQNTLESLFGFRPDVSTLPTDDDTGGFDTSGASLFFSSDQFEQYRSTAKHAMEHALARARKPAPEKTRIEGKAISKEAIAVSAAKLDTYRRAAAFLDQDEKPSTEFGFRDQAHAKKQFQRAKPVADQLDYYFLNRPESKTGTVLLPYRIKGMPTFRLKSGFRGGKYKVRIRAGCYEDVPARERFIDIGFEAGKNRHELDGGLVKVSGTIDKPELIELELQHPPDEWGSFVIRQRNYDKASSYYLQQKKQRENGVGRAPAIWVDYIEIEGPFFDNRSPETLQTLVGLKSKPLKKEQAVKTINGFATRAFRGKVPSQEFVEKLTAYYLAKCKNGGDPGSAMVDCWSLVLSSPSFLYIVEPRHGEDRVPLGDRELAIRLAYFLWSAPPDKQLLKLAEEGKLSKPDVLQAETQRLLQDPRSDEFISGFTHQWLDMKRIDMFDFSVKFHPEFDESVRDSARQEVYETIRHCIDNKLPINTLLKSDFVVVNDVLSDFYGLETVNGSDFQKVSLPKNSPRGGLLGMAAIHVMGSDGQRSSPVERGAWVLRHLLNDPPPPAPANIPMLEHEDQVMSIRDLQKRHQTEPQCAQCHQRIDPIGYGMENFTAAGLWRDKEQVELIDPKRTKAPKAAPEFKTFAIDPTGVLPGGQTFDDYFALRDTILKDYNDTFARGLAQNLIAYGLGRPYEISDYNLATKVISDASNNGDSISAFIHALVQSEAFRIK